MWRLESDTNLQLFWLKKKSMNSTRGKDIEDNEIMVLFRHTNWELLHAKKIRNQWMTRWWHSIKDGAVKKIKDINFQILKSLSHYTCESNWVVRFESQKSEGLQPFFCKFCINISILILRQLVIERYQNYF